MERGRLNYSVRLNHRNLSAVLNRSKRIAVCLIVVLVLLSLVLSSTSASAIGSGGGLGEQADSASSTSGNYGSSMIVMEANSGRILEQSNAHIKKPMASTTKVVTALTVIKNVRDLSEIVTVPKIAVGVEGSSIYLEVNEKIKVIDLLYGLMLQSGNDSAVALAVHTSGSVEKFAELMNKTAKAIGAENSNFVNPHGLHDDNHYTTAYDLGLISCSAMKNEVFKKIVGTATHNASWEGRDYDRVLHNKNKILKTFDGGNGIKTGYTKKAGRCLVAAAQRGDMQLVSVVLNCAPMFEECSRLMEKAFNNYAMTEILADNSYMGEVTVNSGTKGTTRVFSRKRLVYPLRADELGLITKVLDVDKNLSAPLKKGQEVGKIKIYLNNHLLFTQKIYTIDSIESINLIDRLRDIVDKWF